MTTIELNNGVRMPALGLGVFQTPPDETRDAVTAALRTGYRHIDTAAAYGNEKEVGEALRASDVPREEVFDFDLDEAEVAALDALDTDRRGGPEPEDVTLEAYGRAIPEA